MSKQETIINKSIERYIENINTGWVRLFPENPELEEVFME